MTDPNKIQTVHGVTSPIVKDKVADVADTAPSEPKHYRDAAEERLDLQAQKSTNARGDEPTGK